MCESCGSEQKTEQTKQADCCEGGKKGLFELLNKKQAFVFGIVEGGLVLCTIGFFITLALLLSGGVSTGSAGAKTVKAPKQFAACLDGGGKEEKVRADAQLGNSLGVGGTPNLFVNGYLVGGNYPYDAVKTVIDALLAGQTPKWDEEKYGKLEKVELPELSDVIWRGNKDAKVSLVEFSDFECPFCVTFSQTIEQVLTNYGDKVRFTYKHFPLYNKHPVAAKAAEAFECAREQGKAWEMHDKMFALTAQGRLSLDAIKQAANELKLK